MVEVDIEWRIDPVYRRRSQNRIAQRKFRQLRKTSKFALNDSSQPVSIRDSASITETDLLQVPNLQDSTDLGTNSSEYLTRIVTSAQASGTIFDQNLDFISLRTSRTPSASPMSSDSFNFYGALGGVFLTNHSDHAQHKGSGYEPHIHPGMALIPHNCCDSSQSRLTKEGPTSVLPKPDGQSKGWLSLLHIAARRGHEPIVRTLISHNIDCNEKDSDIRTAFIHASIDGHESVVGLLLTHGARISDVDRRGRSALDWEQGIDAYDDMGWITLHVAIEKGFEVGIQLLLASGADLNAKAKKTCNGDDDKDDSRIVQAG
ncbi:hypothetical protein EAF00_008307 [Botryotinia globosa]|nr:hypothetical protein EAF00_008307 [Botryotinia globosa]